MKKYLWPLLLLPVMFYFFGIRKEETEVSSATQIATSHPPKKTDKIFLSKRASVVKTDDSCGIASNKLDDIDFNAPIKDWLDILKFEDFSKCKDAELAERITLIQQKCFGDKLHKDDCFTNLLMFRSVMRVRSIKDPSTREELADLILAEFSKKVPDFKKLKEFSGELLRQDPNDKPVQKVWAMSAVISEDPQKLKSELVDEIYKTLDPDDINNDPELRGLDIIIKTKLKPDAVEDYTREILKANPKDLRSREMLGWSLWKQGRREEALAQIDAIIAQKRDPYLIKLRENLLSPNATKDSYPGRLSLGVKLEDLWN